MNPPTVIFNLHRSELGKLVFTDASGAIHENVLPVRLFPLTDPTHWISIISTKGHDLACIEDVDVLPDEVKKLLLDSLANRDFVPVIQSILAIRHAAHGYEWFVTTDRGNTHFCVENDESIQPLGGGNIVVIDHRNTRYLIPDPAALDPASRQKFEHYY